MLLRRSVLIVAMLCAVSSARADFVVLGGSGYIDDDSGLPTQTVAAQFSIGAQTATSLTLPGGSQGTISYTAVDSIRGWVIYVGYENDDTTLLIFRGSVVSTEIETISVPVGTMGQLFGVAIDSDGNAVMVGYDSSANQPLILRLALGASTAVQITPTGSGITGGSLYSVAIAPGNVAILGGQGASAPLIYALSAGSTEPTVVSIPNPLINGNIQVIAVGPSGTAILGGDDYTDNQALIYSLPAYSSSANLISIPDVGDGGNLLCVAIGPDNTAILGGQNNTGLLIYRVSPGSSSATLIGNPNNDSGSINGVAIGSDGTAILGGEDDTTGLPLISRLAPGASDAVLIPSPSGVQGVITAVSIGAQDIAVLAGSLSGGSSGLLIFTLPLNGSSITSVSSQITLGGDTVNNIAIYPCNGTYDIRRLRPYYYFQQNETVNALRSAGL